MNYRTARVATTPIVISIKIVFVLTLCVFGFGYAASGTAAKIEDETVLKDVGWPRQITVDGSVVIVHQPQIEKWNNYVELVGRVAISITPKGASKEIFGAMQFTADTETNFKDRNVLVYNKRLGEVTFPGQDEELLKKLTDIVGKIKGTPEIMALDRVLAYLEDDSPDAAAAAAKKTTPNLNVAPPAIFTSQNKRAVLVILDGEPVLAPVKDTKLMYAVNTNWDMFLDQNTKSYFLRKDEVWLKAGNYKGPWSPAGTLPADFAKLPSDDNWKEVKKNLPGKKVSSKKAPAVIVSTKPAELIKIDGKPKHKKIKGTKLEYVKNTESDLFRNKNNGDYFFLVSGRWFRAKTVSGPWTAVTGRLSMDFRRIPADHPKAHVLVSIPGTPQAQAAVVQAQIPQRAAINRKTATVKVTYQGEPKFKQIEGTTMSYAVNSANDVLKVGDKYLVCEKAVWFESDSPNGPWVATDKIPKDVSTIPATSPVHHVTYVNVYSSNPNVIVYGYTAGYMGMYVWNGVVVYGTGWYYPPYVYYGGLYPIYYPYPYSYGCMCYYSYYSGTYARGAAVYGPYGGYGWGAAYNPATGTYARSVGAWGPYGGGRVTQAYNPRTGVYAQGGLAYGPGGVIGGASAVNLRTGTGVATRQSASPYAQWGQSVARRGNDWVRTGHYADSRGNVVGFGTSEGTGGIRFRNNQGGTATVLRGKDDLYASRDGNVYKRDGRGSWQKFDNGGWNNAGLSSQQRQNLNQRAGERTGGLQNRAGNRTNVDAAARQNANRALQRDPAARRQQQLQRDARARQKGTQRSRQFQTNRNRTPRRGGGRRRF